MKNISRLTFLLTLFFSLDTAFAEGPKRSGTLLNPKWDYNGASIYTENQNTGTKDRYGDFHATQASKMGYLDGPFAQVCQPLFNGTGFASSSMRIKISLTDNPPPLFKRVVAIELTAFDGQYPIVDIENITIDDFIEDEWFTITNRINIPNGAKDVCLSVYSYPQFYTPGEEIIKDVYISYIQLTMNSNVIIVGDNK